MNYKLSDQEYYDAKEVDNAALEETISDWIFLKMGLDHDETWSSDHLDYSDTVKKIQELLN